MSCTEVVDSVKGSVRWGGGGKVEEGAGGVCGVVQW